jgi:diguanylate cyclase (GGDEF)-like protein
MTGSVGAQDVLTAKRDEQTPQALARLAVVCVFIALWSVLWAARIPLPAPFLLVLCLEALFFVLYLPVIAVLPAPRAITFAYWTMLAAEIVFHSAMVYFLGGVTWLGGLAYVFGLIFTNTFLTLRQGALYTTGVVAAFVTMAALEYTGALPYYGFQFSDSRLYRDGEFVAITTICGGGALFSIYLWIHWVGSQIRRERDAAVRASSDLLAAQQQLEKANAVLETRVRERTAELQAREDLLQATLASTEDGILVAFGREAAYLNERLTRMFNIDPSVVATLDTRAIALAILNQIEERDTFMARLVSLLNASDEYRDSLQGLDGRAFEVYSRPLIRADETVGRVFSFRDVTDRRKAEEALRERARRDALTGALNHAAITDALGGILDDANGSRSVAVAMVDVDGMKAVNDTYGHPVGDEVLITVAKELARDGIVVGRYGGDEFLAILPGVTRAEAEAYSESVAHALAHASVIDRETAASIPVVAAIGVAVYPEEAETIDDLIRLADHAMYAEKKLRPLRGGHRSARTAANDRTAKIIGELVPLLTSPGDINDKMRLVAHQLSTGAGYDALDLHWWDPETLRPVARAVLVRGAPESLAIWSRAKAGTIVEVLASTRRPMILKDPAHDERLSPEQRRAAELAGMHSGLFVPMIWQDRLNGVIAAGSRRRHAFGPRDAQFLTAVATQVTAIIRMSTMVEELQQASERLHAAQADTVLLLAAAAEAHDQTTGRHLQRVRAVTVALALEMGYDPAAADELGVAAILHDIGKIRVPDSILLRPGSLTAEEWTVMEQHTTWGREFLAGRPEFDLAALVAAAHHERWDGTGYPLRLSGDDIPESAQIVSVADAFDAMTSDRPYRFGRTAARAVREIVACSGTQFSPRVVNALLRLHQRRRLPRAYAEAA